MQKIRNIAIIADVDHGKTTLVDQLLRQMVDGVLLVVDAHDGPQAIGDQPPPRDFCALYLVVRAKGDKFKSRPSGGL